MSAEPSISFPAFGWSTDTAPPRTRLLHVVMLSVGKTSIRGLDSDRTADCEHDGPCSRLRWMPAPVGVPGELVAGGDGVALGYVGPTGSLEQNFLPDRFSAQPGARLYRTGDRVRWRPDGVLEFLGRFDNQVKIRGHRIEPNDVAACLAEHEFVRQAVVISRLAASGAAQLVACVVPQSTDYSAPELRKLLTLHVTERLPPYMVPTVFRFMHDLPLKPNGKVDFVALEDGQNDSEPTRINSPPTAVEARLLKILQELLRNGDLGRDDDFFEAGGDSLLAITLISRLESEFETELPSRVMEAFTARRLAAILELVSRSTYPAGVVEIRGGTTNRPIFCLPGLAGTAFRIPRLGSEDAYSARDFRDRTS